jgi:pimeloyl-ACP methyl ester carboxylesterase
MIGCKYDQQTKKKEEETNSKVELKTHVELKTVEIDNYIFHYMDIGEGEPVVFVHGSVGDYRVWEAQMEAFSENHRVIALSRRFAYPNDQELKASNDYSVTAHATDLVQFLEKLEDGPVHLVGHSYGAFTSLVATLDHPELVKSLTLGEPPLSSIIMDRPESEEMMSGLINYVFAPADKAFTQDDEESAVAIFIEGVLADSTYYDNAPQEERDLMLSNTPELRAIVSGADLFPNLSCSDLQELDIPVLLVKGDQSPLFLRMIIDRLSTCLPNNEVLELPNTSHGLEYQNPEGFNAGVLDFINVL